MNDFQRRLASLSPAQRVLLEEKLTAVGKPLLQTPSVQPKQPARSPLGALVRSAATWCLDQPLAASSRIQELESGHPVENPLLGQGARLTHPTIPQEFTHS
jgi:hypothetical protein